MKKLLYPVVAILCLANSCSSGKQKHIDAGELRCEYLEDPLGIDLENPRFSWIIESGSGDILQSAYEIIVSKEDKNFSDANLVWSSGKISSPRSVNVRYDGTALESQSIYFWQVRIWDQHDMESKWSKLGKFHTGFLGKDGFSTQWIMAPDKAMRSPILRKEVKIEKKIESAFIYATAIGLYELYINGAKVDNRLFEPATTQFTERVLYSVYEVSAKLNIGDNVIGLWMGEGQSAYSKPPAGRFHNNNMKVPPFDRPMMLMELRVNYSDGTHEIIGTDQDWKCMGSPLIFNNYFGGEDYDARLEIPDWSKPGIDASEWSQVIPGAYAGKISAQLIQPVMEGRSYEPIASIQRDEHTIDYDFGTTIGGYWEIEVEGQAGAEVMIRGTEKCGSPVHQKPLTEENQLYWESNHTGKYFYRDCQSKYILKGEGREVYKPRFFYHGYRYVQVRVSDPEKVKIIRVNNIETGNSVAQVGSFDCSDGYLNRLHGNIVQTFKNNLIQGVPLSNPNSEKYGWTGDVHLFSETADYTFDLAAFWTKWMQDFPDAQNWVDASGLIPVTVPELRLKQHVVSDVTWLAVYPFVLSQMYHHCQDTEIIRAHYAPLKKWIQHILDVSDDYIADGMWGDHLIPGDGQQAHAASLGMTRLLNTAYLYRISNIMAGFAEILGLEDDVSHYKNLAAKVYSAFNEEFYKEDLGIYLENPSPEGFYYELTSNLVPLQMGVVPNDSQQGVLDFVLDHIASKDYRSYTGILGTKALIDVLQESKQQEFLYQIVWNTEFPGWGYTMEELGASTLNQNWNGKGDFNHCMYGSIDEFFYNDLLGIKFEVSGEEKLVLINPFIPDNLTHASGKAFTIFGAIESGWKKTTDGIDYGFSIPHNTQGVFSCSIEADNYEIVINNKLVIRNNLIEEDPQWVKDIQFDEGKVKIMLGSGKYDLSLK